MNKLILEWPRWLVGCVAIVMAVVTGGLVDLGNETMTAVTVYRFSSGYAERQVAEAFAVIGWTFTATWAVLGVLILAGVVSVMVPK